MLLFAKVLDVTEKRRHAALKRHGVLQNSKGLRWNADVRQKRLERVFPMRETVGDESPGTT
jgi:hypothetical protein